jgi:tRNA(fMet)-specific endonuclease VapC
MPFLLDTNVCIGILTGRSPKAIEKLRQCSPAELRICSVVRAELQFGARNSSRVETNLDLLETFLSPFTSVPFDDHAANYYGRIRADLYRAGQLIGPNDLLIAAMALANDFVMVTHNVREFGRVAGLRWVDWES